MRAANACKRSPTCGSLARPSMTSTTFIRGTGLKKWNPATRSGRRHSRAMPVTDSDEVLVARMQSSATTASSWASNACLASRRSIMASTTSSTSLSSVSAVATCRRSSVACASAPRILPLLASLSSVCSRLSRAAWAAPSRLSNSITCMPAWAAIWAMPVPMMPAPTTAIRLISRVMLHSPEKVAWRFSRKAVAPSFWSLESNSN